MARNCQFVLKGHKKVSELFLEFFLNLAVFFFFFFFFCFCVYFVCVCVVCFSCAAWNAQYFLCRKAPNTKPKELQSLNSRKGLDQTQKNKKVVGFRA